MITGSGESRGYLLAEAYNPVWGTDESQLLTWWVQEAERTNNLLTSDGQHLVVLAAGAINDGPGPDILNCHLLLDDLEYSGPVEMHLDARSWFDHGHAGDPAYQQVILHVVTRQGGGPDLPTLVVPTARLSRQVCLACRPVTTAELLAAALERFQRKQVHLQQLSRTEYSPLLLGMLEVLSMGPQRRKYLQQTAIYLGLSAWPDIRPWRGSRRRYPRSRSPGHYVKRLITHHTLFDEERWRGFAGLDSDEQNRVLKMFDKLGLPAPTVVEWLVNYLAPSLGEVQGFPLWINREVKRHYGLERFMKNRLGLMQIRYVFEQQALLHWQQKLCLPRKCPSCPLVHPL